MVPGPQHPLPAASAASAAARLAPEDPRVPAAAPDGSAVPERPPGAPPPERPPGACPPPAPFPGARPGAGRAPSGLVRRRVAAAHTGGAGPPAPGPAARKRSLSQRGTRGGAARRRRPGPRREPEPPTVSAACLLGPSRQVGPAAPGARRPLGVDARAPSGHLPPVRTCGPDPRPSTRRGAPPNSPRSPSPPLSLPRREPGPRLLRPD